MKFRLIIDENLDEEVAVTVHKRSSLADAIEDIVMHYSGSDKITAIRDGEITILTFDKIQCIFVEDNKTYALSEDGKKYRLKLRLYEAEEFVPSSFFRINKSCIANEKFIERFTATYSGGVNAIFKSGYSDYVSRRCFSDIKRRFGLK